MRPAGEIRRALREAAQALLAESAPGVTWRDLAAHAAVGQQVARRTVVNMARAGELRRSGAKHVPGGRRPMTTYTLPPPTPSVAPLALDALMRSWGR
jgi:hypothetical protein